MYNVFKKDTLYNVSKKDTIVLHGMRKNKNATCTVYLKKIHCAIYLKKDTIALHCIVLHGKIKNETFTVYPKPDLVTPVLGLKNDVHFMY